MLGVGELAAEEWNGEERIKIRTRDINFLIIEEVIDGLDSYLYDSV